MSRSRKTPDQNAANAIDDGLNGLFGALSDAIGEMAARLDDGKAGAVTRDHVFQTPKGPIRAHAGVRLRMGGLDIGDQPEPVQPVNPGRPKPAAQDDGFKPLAYEIFEDEADWILTADLPGVSRKELDLTQNGSTLSIKTNGARRHSADVDLQGGFDINDIATTLRNGVLTLQIPKAVAS